MLSELFIKTKGKKKLKFLKKLSKISKKNLKNSEYVRICRRTRFLLSKNFWSEYQFSGTNHADIPKIRPLYYCSFESCNNKLAFNFGFEHVFINESEITSHFDPQGLLANYLLLLSGSFKPTCVTMHCIRWVKTVKFGTNIGHPLSSHQNDPKNCSR